LGQLISPALGANWNRANILFKCSRDRDFSKIFLPCFDFVRFVIKT